jgi:putative transposase
VTLPAQRDAVQFLIAGGLSERRACTLLELQRSTFQYQPRPARDGELVEQVRSLAQRHPRYGYRRVWALLRRRGQQVNKKRIHRLWKRSKLQVRKGQRKRRVGPASGVPVQATHPGHVWAYDFVYAHCRNGSVLKILTVMDEFTREGLALDVATSIPAHRVIGVLTGLFAQHGAPQYLRSDNGPEFIALAVRNWLTQQHTATLYIDPGCPWQNGYGERFNGTVRDECLNVELFHNVAEARVRLHTYRRQYNEERPHSSLGYRTPVEFKHDWLQRQSQPEEL